MRRGRYALQGEAGAVPIRTVGPGDCPLACFAGSTSNSEHNASSWDQRRLGCGAICVGRASGGCLCVAGRRHGALVWCVLSLVFVRRSFGCGSAMPWLVPSSCVIRFRCMWCRVTVRLTVACRDCVCGSAFETAVWCLNLVCVEGDSQNRVVLKYYMTKLRSLSVRKRARKPVTAVRSQASAPCGLLAAHEAVTFSDPCRPFVRAVPLLQGARQRRPARA